jgi:hypothetical protein
VYRISLSNCSPAQIFADYMELEVPSFTKSHHWAICTEKYQSSLPFHTLFVWDHFNISLSSTPLPLTMRLSAQDFYISHFSHPYYVSRQCILLCLTSLDLGTGYGLDGRGSITGMGKRFLSLLHSVQTGSVAHPASDPMSAVGCFLR